MLLAIFLEEMQLQVQQIFMEKTKPNKLLFLRAQ